MEEIGLLNIEIPLHLWALHLVFTPRINAALEAFVSTWNNHKLSQCNNKTPRQLYVRGQIDAAKRGFFLNPCPGQKLDDDHPEVVMHAGMDFTLYGSDMVGGQRERRHTDPNVVVEPPAFDSLSQEDIIAIQSQISTEFDEGEDFYGSGKYCRAVELATERLLLHARQTL